MKRYFFRKIFIYLLTFFVAVTIDWMIPRFMPGDPILNMVAKTGAMHSEAQELMYDYFSNLFSLDLPVWQQYLNFWKSLFQGDLGISILQFPKPVIDVIKSAVPYDLLLLIPSILLSYYVGNKFGAFAARSKRLDNTILPIGYILTATPYMWLGILLGWVFAIILHIFPISGAYSFTLKPAFTWQFIKSVLYHWFLPFMSLFIVQLGGWAIGMRNMIIYELEADYAHYLEALGAPRKLIRRYAYNNAQLPQLSGLALKLGVIVAGAMATEMVFSYPGIGYLILKAIKNSDYFLLQGCFLFIIIGVLLANFIIDIVFIVIDPRTRLGMQGGNS